MVSLQGEEGGGLVSRVINEEPVNSAPAHPSACGSASVSTPEVEMTHLKTYLSPGKVAKFASVVLKTFICQI